MQLLTAALGVIGIEPHTVTSRWWLVPVESLGERLVEAVLGLWGLDGGDTVRVAIPAVMSDAGLRSLLPQFIGVASLGPMVRALDLPDAPLRTALVASQTAGLLLTRFLVPVEPLVSTPPAAVAALEGPTIQRYLTRDLAGRAAPEE